MRNSHFRNMVDVECGENKTLVLGRKRDGTFEA
jgi:hypothetical protein